jgi:phosphoserine phosphatase
MRVLALNKNGLSNDIITSATSTYSQNIAIEAQLDTETLDRARIEHPNTDFITLYTSDIRLAVFDMDSTLIQQEVIDELASHLNIGHLVSTITEDAMNGKIDFKESLSRRVSLLKGADESIIEQVRSKITFTPGVRTLCRVLKNKGCVLAVISGILYVFNV